MSYLAGLLSPAERKNSWQLAEIMGAPNPDGFQHLLGRADWSSDPKLATDVANSVAEQYMQRNFQAAANVGGNRRGEALALLEPSLAEMPVGEAVQFERLGYFCADPASGPDTLVFNRTIELRDTWAKLQVGG